MNKNITNLFLLSTLLLFVTACGAVRTTPVQTTGMSPKHEFRGVWVQTVGQSRYRQMNSAAIKQYLAEKVRKLDEAGINAVIFQVRPEADAFYHSNLEPWSRFLTGTQG